MSLKEHKKKILLVALLCAFVFLSNQYKKGLHYTAHGLFKITPSCLSTENTLKSLLSGGAKQTSMAFLCYPIMEAVTKKLCLQAELSEHKRIKNYNRLKHKLRMEHHSLFSRAVRSSRLSTQNPVTASPMVPDDPERLICKAVDYPHEYALHLTIRFIDDQNFWVKQGRKKIGKGKLDTPFHYKGASFTLQAISPSLAKGRFNLTLLPLAPCAKSLSKKVHVEPSMGDNTLYSFSFTHPDRFFAADVINTCMEKFQEWQYQELSHKIASQVSYLNRRKESVRKETEEQLDSLAKANRLHFANKGFFSFESEADYVNQTQSEILSAQMALTSEMAQLDMQVNNNLRGEEALFLYLEAEKELKKEGTTLPISSIRQELTNYFSTLKAKELLIQQINEYLEALEAGQPLVTTLPITLGHQGIQASITHLLQLEKQLIDEKNYTQRERDFFKEQHDLEREILANSLSHLKEESLLLKKNMEEEIIVTKKLLLDALYEEYLKLQDQLLALTPRIESLPERWNEHERMQSFYSLQKELVGSLTRVIEGENVAHHTQAASSRPIEPAFVPTIMDPPHLLLSFILGAFFGLFSSLFCLLLWEGWKGPAASLENLKNCGFLALGQLSAHLKAEFHHLKIRDQKILVDLVELMRNPQIILLNQQHSTRILPALLDLMSTVEKKILSIDLVQTKDLGLLNHLEDPSTPLEIHSNANIDEIRGGASHKQELFLLTSSAFQDLLNKWRHNYSKIIITLNSSPKGLLVPRLCHIADQSLFVLSNQPLDNVAWLDAKKTLFLLQQRIEAPNRLNLHSFKNIKKIVEKFLTIDTLRTWNIHR